MSKRHSISIPNKSDVWERLDDWVKDEKSKSALIVKLLEQYCEDRGDGYAVNERELNSPATQCNPYLWEEWFKNMDTFKLGVEEARLKTIQRIFDRVKEGKAL
jgi:hypothetical protein